MAADDIDLSDIPAAQPAQGNGLDFSEFISMDPVQAQKYKDEQKYGGIGQQALTIGEGLAKGAVGAPVVAGAEKALTGLGVPNLTPEAQAGRANVNPIESGLSEAGGFGASLATGEGIAPLVGKVGEAASGFTKAGEAINAAREAALAAGETTKAADKAARVAGLPFSLPQKIAQGGVQAGAEFAALQTSNEIANQINNPGEAMGQAAINIGLSGIIGGATGGVLGAASPLWQATFGNKTEGFLGLLKNKVDGVGLTVDSDLQTFLDNAEAQGVKIPDEIKAGLSNNPTARNIFKTLRDAGGTSSEALIGAIEQTKQVAQDQIADVLGENGPSAFEAGESAKEALLSKAEELNNNVRSQYESVGDATAIEVPSGERIKFHNQLVEDGKNFGANGSPAQNLFKTYAERAIAQDTIGQLDKLNTEIGSEASVAYRSGDFEKYKALSTIRDSIREFQDAQIGKSVSEKMIPDTFTAEHEAAYGSEQKMLEERKRLTDEVVNARKDARKTYSQFMDQLADMASMGKAGKVKSYGQFEEAIQNVPSAKLASRLFDKKNIEALRSLQKEYPDVFAKIVQQQKTDLLESASKQGVLNHNTVMNKINSLPKEVKDLMFTKEELSKIEGAHATIRQLNERFNPSGTAGALSKAFGQLLPAAGAAIGAIAGHGVGGAIGGSLVGELTKLLGKNAPDAAKLALLKFVGSSNEISSPALKSAFDYIKLVSKGDAALNSSVKNFFKTGAVLPNHFYPTKESREKLETALDAVNKDPQKMTTVAGNLGHYMPDHASAAGTTAAIGQNYLNSLKPKQIVSSPLDATPPIDKAQQAKYDRALDLAQQPLLAIQHAKDGTLQGQDVTTLNTIYPGLHSKMVQGLTNELINAKTEGTQLSYKQRTGLSLLMGKPLDSTMTQGSMAAIINANAGQQAPQTQPRKTKNATGTALKQMNKVTDLYKTSLEARASDRRS